VPDRWEVATRSEELFDRISLGGAVAHRRHGGFDRLGQAVVGVLDLVAEDRLGVFEVVGDRAGVDVGVEHHASTMKSWMKVVNPSWRAFKIAF
jgi:hypothetical protein